MIDLRSGKEAEADIALRLEVLFHDEIVVRNGLLNGEWGEEEREENRKPFTLGNPLVPGILRESVAATWLQRYCNVSATLLQHMSTIDTHSI